MRADNSRHLIQAARQRADQTRRWDNRELRDSLAQALGDQRTSAILGPRGQRDTPN